VDWILQVDPPDDPRDYIHRVGRTARGSNGKGRSLIFLQPSEVGFLKHLKEARVPLVEFELPAKKILNIQSQLEKLINSNYYLNKVRHHPCPSLPPHTYPFWQMLTIIIECKRRVPLLPKRLRLPLPSQRFRHPKTRSSQACKVLWIYDTA
jgi:hypothetical protein